MSPPVSRDGHYCPADLLPGSKQVLSLPPGPGSRGFNLSPLALSVFRAWLQAMGTPRFFGWRAISMIIDTLETVTFEDLIQPSN